MTPPSAKAAHRRAVRHWATGLRPKGCKCVTCDPSGALSRPEPKPEPARIRARSGPMAFERYAISPRRAIRMSMWPPVICCEREAFDDEGSNAEAHYDCPGKAAS